MRPRWIVAGIAIVLAAAVAALVVVADRWLDANRDRILAEAERSLGRELRVGDAGVTFLGRPGVSLSDIVIGEDPAFGTEPFVTAPSASVSVRLLPLLAGRVEVASIDLKRPAVRLVRAADGRLSTSTLGRPREGRGGTTGAGSGGGAGARGDLAWLVALFDLDRGEVVFVDETQSPPRVFTLGRIDLEVSDIAVDRVLQFDLAAAFESTSANVHLAGEIGPLVTPGGVPFSVKGRAEEIPVERILPAVSPDLAAAAEGMATVAIDVQGVGGEVADARRALRGSVSADVTDGVLRNFNLPGEIVRRVTEMPGLTTLISRGVKPKYAAVLERPDTRFEAMQLRLRAVADGWQVETVRIDGEDYGATASGTVDWDLRADLRGDVALSRRFSEDIASDVREARLLFDGDGRLGVPFVYRGVLGQARPRADVEKIAASVLRGRSKDLVEALREGGVDGEGAVDLLRRRLSDWIGR
jgi:hypothetical protein